MYTKQPKKLMILNILDIFRRYTDENHRLSQKEIIDILKTEYDMTADRKAVRRNILNLMDCGYRIEYSETIRMVPILDSKTKKPLIDPETGKPKTEESYIWSDFYLERDFTDGELRLLIDSLLFSRHIPYSQCKELVEKLENLSNVYFKSRISHIARLPEEHGDNKQLFLNVSTPTAFPQIKCIAPFDRARSIFLSSSASNALCKAEFSSHEKRLCPVKQQVILYTSEFLVFILHSAS